MFAFILIIYGVFYLSEAFDILTFLWDMDIPEQRSISLPGADSNIIVQRLSKVPFTEMLKHDVWSKLSEEKQMEKFSPKEWSKFESLIPYLPVSILEKVNTSDESLLSYFGQVKLSKPQVAKLAEDILLQNPDVLEDGKKLHLVGNIFCGFHSNGVKTIKESVLRSLIETNFFHKIKSCDVEKLRDLLEALRKHTMIGPPRIWRPETVKQAGILISGMTVTEIREIQEMSFSQISPEVIESSPVELLKSVRDDQLKTLSKPALLSWRRKTQDMRPLYDNSGCSLEISPSSVAIAIILSNSLHFLLV